MSYCRWSTDNYSCDIYAYESVGDVWMIHVAGNRPIREVPKVPRYRVDMTPAERSGWHEAHQTQLSFMANCQREFIDLPHAGEAIECATLQEFKDKMLELRAIGYRFPDSVLEEIDAEMAQ